VLLRDESQTRQKEDMKGRVKHYEVSDGPRSRFKSVGKYLNVSESNMVAPQLGGNTETIATAQLTLPSMTAFLSP
jgi:hypothetical protein